MATTLIQGKADFGVSSGGGFYGYENGCSYTVALNGANLVVTLSTPSIDQANDIKLTCVYNGTTKSQNCADGETAGWTFPHDRTCTTLTVTGEELYLDDPGFVVFDRATLDPTLDLSWPQVNTAPTATLSVPASVTAGKTAALSWSTSDADGDTVTTTKLVRYLKKAGASSYTSTTLISTSSTRKSYSDTIPADAGGGSVYYVLTVSDGLTTTTKTSSTITIGSNNAPEISGSDGSLGTFDLTAPTHSYSVTDADGHEVTVTESLDGTVLRTYTATLGTTNALTIPALTWLKTLNGSHTITITATDSEGASVTRTLSLIKNVTSLSFTLATPLEADAQITKAIEKIVAEIPEGAIITIEVCNNGYDESPTWEDVTQRVLNGEKFFFDNVTKTAANWGYNVRVNVRRNGAAGDCYVVSMGGYFE